jgi:WD40 repeat protein
MNDQHMDDQKPSYHHASPGFDIQIEKHLEERIIHTLHAKAQHVSFTSELRERVLSRITSKRTFLSPPTRTWSIASVLVAILVLFAGIAFYFNHSTSSPTANVIVYRMGAVLTVPSELAQGGHIIALDPTEQHIVYQPANQPGVMYTLDLAKPVASNLLAMRYTLDAVWAPDGSALVATVAPTDTTVPLLAVVPDGQYMHPLGYTATAASWSPTNKQYITYTQQTSQTTQLWETPADGQATLLLATMRYQLSVQHMSWTKDGRLLALTVGKNGSANPTTLNQPGRALYVMDAHTNGLQQLVAPGNFTLGTVAWSPDGRFLSYEQINAQGKVTLQTLAIAHPQNYFSITPKQLEGWSWSPDSRSILYSDAGKLHTHILQGADIQLPQMTTSLASPFWLKDGRILCLQIQNGVGKLIYLLPQHTK